MWQWWEDLKAKRVHAARKATTVSIAVSGPITLREDRDCLRPGMVVLRDGRSYRVTKLLMVNRLGAFYEAKAE